MSPSIVNLSPSAAAPDTASARPVWPLLRSVVLPLVVSLICLRSLFRDGYLLQVDIVFGPRAGPVLPGFGAPVSGLQAAAVDVLGGEATGKLYAVGALFLAGCAPMILFRRAPWYAQCVAGLLGALNPWVYDRMVEGQWGVVVAAAGLFLWLAAWDALQAHPSLTPAVLLAVCSAAIVAFDPHAVGPVAVLTIVAFAWKRVWRDRNRLRWTALSQAMLALLLAYGVVLFFVGGHSGSYENVRQFTRADFEFFRSVANDDYGLVVNLVGLYGYWGERVGRFPLATGGAEWWPLTTAVIVGAAVLGAWLKRDRAWLLLCGLIGLLLSASTALPGGVDAAVWLSSRLPLVSAYREPQKWSALWLLALVTLAAGAVEAIAAAAFRWPSPPAPHARDGTRLRTRDRGSCPRRQLADPLAPDDREAAALPRLLVRDGCVPRTDGARRRAHRRPPLAPLPALARDRGTTGGQSRSCLLSRATHGAAQPRDSRPCHRDRFSLRPNRPRRRAGLAPLRSRADPTRPGDSLGPRPRRRGER